MDFQIPNANIISNNNAIRTPPDRDPWTEIPLDRDPQTETTPDRDPLDIVPQTETPLDRDLPRHSLPWTDISNKNAFQYDAYHLHVTIWGDLTNKDPPGQTPPWTETPTVNRITDRCKNITFVPGGKY